METKKVDIKAAKAAFNQLADACERVGKAEKSADEGALEVVREYHGTEASVPSADKVLSTLSAARKSKLNASLEAFNLDAKSPEGAQWRTFRQNVSRARVCAREASKEALSSASSLSGLYREVLASRKKESGGAVEATATASKAGKVKADTVKAGKVKADTVKAGKDGAESEGKRPAPSPAEIKAAIAALNEVACQLPAEVREGWTVLSREFLKVANS